MQRKTMLGLAAVGAVVALLYMRSKTAVAATGGTAAVSSGASQAAGWTSALAGLLASANKGSGVQVNIKQPVVDTYAASPAPAPAPVPAPAASGGAVFGGTVAGVGETGGKMNDKGEWVYADGSIYRGPSVTANQAMGIMGF